jgi:hypothetical protein
MALALSVAMPCEGLVIMLMVSESPSVSKSLLVTGSSVVWFFWTVKKSSLATGLFCAAHRFARSSAATKNVFAMNRIRLIF